MPAFRHLPPPKVGEEKQGLAALSLLTASDHPSEQSEDSEHEVQNTPHTLNMNAAHTLNTLAQSVRSDGVFRVRRESRASKVLVIFRVLRVCRAFGECRFLRVFTRHLRVLKARPQFHLLRN